MKVSTIFPKDHLPKPTGPYRIGTVKYDLEDISLMSNHIEKCGWGGFNTYDS